MSKKYLISHFLNFTMSKLIILVKLVTLERLDILEKLGILLNLANLLKLVKKTGSAGESGRNGDFVNRDAYSKNVCFLWEPGVPEVRSMGPE